MLLPASDTIHIACRGSHTLAYTGDTKLGVRDCCTSHRARSHLCRLYCQQDRHMRRTCTLAAPRCGHSVQGIC